MSQTMEEHGSGPLPPVTECGNNPENATSTDRSVNILSLDGGGVRGVASLIVLRDIMEQLKRHAGKEEMPKPCDYFDLIGGTSTGGLIAIMLGRLRMSVQECIDKYYALAKKVFNIDAVFFGKIPFGDNQCRFDYRVLEEEIRRIVNTPRSHCGVVVDPDKGDDGADRMVDKSPSSTPTFVVATKLLAPAGPPTLFRTYDCVSKSADTCYIWQAARATTAAPSFFAPITITDPKPPATYLDGGLKHNNPAELALYEAKSLWPDAKRFCVISLGTGVQRSVTLPRPISLSQSFMAMVPGLEFFIGAVRGIKAVKEIAVASIALCTSSLDVHHRMCKTKEFGGTNILYHRFDPDGVDDVGLQDWNKLEKLGQTTQSYVERPDIVQSLKHCVQLITCTDTAPSVTNPVSRTVDRDNETSASSQFNLPPTNVFFVGREATLQRIYDALCDEKAKHRVVLHGLGGVGKTQIAIQYSHRFNLYEIVIWINAADHLSLETGFKEFARAYGVLDYETVFKLNLTEVVQSIARWLQRTKTWLLILDNLDEPTVIEDCGLPKTGIHHHILITSRNPNAGGLQSEGVEIKSLDLNSASKLLLSISRSQQHGNNPAADNHQADKIVATLGCLPLAIVQAGAYIHEELGDMEEFLGVYEEEKYRKRLHDRRPEGVWDSKLTIHTTWRMSFRKITNLDPVAGKLLKLLAFLNSDSIQLDFLVACGKGLDKDLQEVVSNRPLLKKSLYQLRRFSLIAWSQDFKSISMHRMVQTVIRDELSDTESTDVMNQAVSSFKEAFPVFTSETREKCHLYSGQIVQPLSDHLSSNTTPVLNLTIHMAEFLIDAGLFEEALHLLQKRVSRIVKEQTRGTSPSAEWRIRLGKGSGDVAFSLGRYAQSKRIFEESLKLARQTLEPCDDLLLCLLQDLGAISLEMSKFDEARMRCEEVVEIRRTLVSAEGNMFNLLTGLNNLALSYKGLGRLSEAKTLMTEALVQAKKALKADNALYFEAQNSLAEICGEMGDLDEAVCLHEESLNGRRRVFGPKHPQTLCSMMDLACIYEKMGRVDLAMHFHAATLEKRRLVLGAEHPHTVASITALESLYRKNGREADATKLASEMEERRNHMEQELSMAVNAVDVVTRMDSGGAPRCEGDILYEEVLRMLSFADL